MESTDEKLISECKEYWNSGGKLDLEQFPTLKKFLIKNSLSSMQLKKDIGTIFDYVTNQKKVNNTIISKIEFYYNIKMISDECYNTIISECNGNLRNLNIEEFSNKYPEYYQELSSEYLREITFRINSIKIQQFPSIMKEILTSTTSNEIADRIMDKIVHLYAVNSIDSYYSGKSEDELIEIISSSFDSDMFFRKDKVGFSKLENDILKKICYITNKFENMPEEITNRIESAFNTKIELDYKRVKDNKNFGELLEFDKYISYLYRVSYNEDFELEDEDFNFIKEMLEVSKEFNIEQLSQIQIFQDFTINFINTYERNKDNKGIDEIAEILKMYLLKCENPEDLLDKTIATITSLMNSEFLKEEDRNKLREIYEQNYLIQFQKRNDARKNEIQQRFPDLLDKVKNRESVTAEELQLIKELAYIERTTDGFFKDEYIDAILKFGLEKDIDYSENNNLIKRILEDKAQKELLEDKTKAHVVITASPDYFIDNIFDSMKFTGGYKKGNMIMLNEEYIERYPMTTVINGIYHEVQHAKQFYAMESKQNRNFLIYDMTKEAKIVDYLGNGYYKNNYEKIKYEIDARIAANIKLVEYLQSLGINDEIIINAIQKDLKKDSELNQSNLRTVEGYADVFIIDNLFQNIAEQDPSILTDFEPFKIEFDFKTGERRGNCQILLEYKKWCEDNKISENQIVVNEYADYYHGSNKKDNKEKIQEKANFYAHILNNESYVYDTIVIDDMLLLPELMNTKSPKFRKMLDKIVKFEILDVAYNYLKDGHIPEEVDMLTFVTAISNLEKYAQNIEKGEFQEEILQIVNYVKEKKEFKENNETNKTNENEKNEINSLKTIAESTNKDEIIQGENAIKQILERDGKTNDK